MISLARGGVKVAFDVCYLANSLLFPTIFAGTVYGFCNFGAKSATVLAPLIAEVEPPKPMIIFTSICIAAALLSFFITVPKKK